MIKRIVKLVIREDAQQDFEDKFSGWKAKIRSQKGCHHLELWHDIDDPRIYFTYSEWTSQDHLDQYRHSDLFADVWPKTKALFDDRPSASSVQRIDGEM